MNSCKYYCEVVKETLNGIDKIIRTKEVNTEDLKHLKQSIIFLDLFLTQMQMLSDEKDRSEKNEKNTNTI